jgi:hypothetical protein
MNFLSEDTARISCVLITKVLAQVTVLTDYETCDHGTPNSSRCKKPHYQESFEPGHKGTCGTKHHLHHAGDYQRLFAAKSEKLISSLILLDTRKLATEAAKM